MPMKKKKKTTEECFFAFQLLKLCILFIFLYLSFCTCLEPAFLPVLCNGSCMYPPPKAFNIAPGGDLSL